MSPSRRYTFGPFTLDLRRGALLRAGVEVKLRPKSFAVLRVLVERHGQLVSKDDLLSAVWGRTVVTEGAITQCLIDIRRALGDESQQMVRTVPRRGHVFDVAVAVSDASADVAPAAAAEPPSEPAAVPDAARPPRATVRMKWAAAAATLALVAGAGVYLLRDRATAPAVPVADASDRSIAVLPFVDLSESRDQQYLSDGITEEILDRLARSTTLKVIARTSSFQFREPPLDVPAIARKLQVTHVLEGSVRRSGERVRVTVQLVDATTNLQVWSQVYDRRVADLFATQDAIADSVASTLEARLVPGVSHRPPRNAAAYDSYLQGRFFIGRRGQGDVERAIASFERAVELDPGFARGWADLSGAYAVAAGYDYAGQWKERQKLAAQRAVAADPNLVAARVRLAEYYFDAGDGLAAQEQFRVASMLDPGDRYLASLATGSGASWPLEVTADELEDARQAVARDPLTPTTRFLYGISLFAAGRLPEALAEFRLALELNPAMQWEQRLEIPRVLVAARNYAEAYRESLQLPEGTPRNYAVAMLVDAEAHRQQADAAFAALSVLVPEDHMHFVRMAELCVLRGRRDDAFAWLERARARIPHDSTRHSRLWWLQADMHTSPFLAPLHDDPRWSPLMVMPDWAAPSALESSVPSRGPTD